MKIELIGAIDYDKLKVELERYGNSEEIIQLVKQLEIERKSQIVATAGRLSRFPGNIFEVLELSEEKTFEQNVHFIKRIVKMGHDSIIDHDYFVFALQDVSPVIEQTIIEERFSSFTIKSRREVDFSQAGFYVPNFRDSNGIILSNNEMIRADYIRYMQSLFDSYAVLTKKGIPVEDARYILPYSYHSNIIMGVDAHTLRNMIVRFTKGKDSRIAEINEFGSKLYDIVQESAPYLLASIDEKKEVLVDPVDAYLAKNIPDSDAMSGYDTKRKVELINATEGIDDTILITSLMRRYQWDCMKAARIYDDLSKSVPNFQEDLMKTIAFKGDGLELTQVQFDFQIPVSYAVLTHYTRHRTHHIIVPDFVPNIDLSKYKTPPTIASTCLDFYKDIYAKNMEMYHQFKDYGICEEDLIYFVLSGNKINVLTSMNGQAMQHILGLRMCNKSQWETRGISRSIREAVSTLPDAQNFVKVLGPTCMTQGYCGEGKESCGRPLTLKKKR